MAVIVAGSIYFYCKKISLENKIRPPQQDPTFGSEITSENILVPRCSIDRRGFDEETFWKAATLEEQHNFTLVYSSYSTNPKTAKEYLVMREKLAEMIYSPMPGSLSNRVVWLSMTELYQKTYGQMEDSLKEGFLTHMTSQESLMLILQSKMVKVMHRQAFKGAFAATFPQYQFGCCGLVFRRNIERVSPLEHGFIVDNTYWAGFSQPIPVTKFSLAYVILETGNIDDCSRLKSDCEAAFGSEIFVTTKDVVAKAFRHLAALNMGIPIEWTRSDTKSGIILQALLAVARARAFAQAPRTVSHQIAHAPMQSVAVSLPRQRYQVQAPYQMAYAPTQSVALQIQAPQRQLALA